MSDDLVRNYNIANNNERQQSILCELQLLLISNPNGKNLSSFSLPMPASNFMERIQNTLLMEEKNYDREQISHEHEASKALLNVEKKEIYEDVLTAITFDNQILAFVFGHGGIGKTFLWSTIISAIRCKGDLVLAVAASGIASLWLPSGRTTHSLFKITFDLADDSLCDIKKNTQLSQLITEAVLINLDEAPTNDRRSFESLSISLQDILDKPCLPFG
ncbi:uncharacterized protein LOC143559765 [Bidens hawaiensis]|uniref:uncharacterized protein LOC143559765 n=1 Tax=Bidens hawaiensis TaxID=980011 RepID=UPI00404974D7